MVITSQSCSVSQQGKHGMVIYLKKRLSEAILDHFPLSKDAGFDYKAKFDDISQTLMISKDEQT